MAKEQTKNKFSDFYTQEYQMLKDAHFQTSEKITTFFQYALLIFSAPLVLLTSDFLEKGLLGIVFIFISLVGYFVMLYLNQLRAESLLYARAINQIRKNIYSDQYKEHKDIVKTNQSLVLLVQDKKPKYFDSSQFIFVVIVLGLFDSFYFGFGIYTIIPLPGIYCEWALDNNLIIAFLSFIIGLIFNLGSFKMFSNYNENGSTYFKRIIGVDIDGVLNKHEEQFAKIYNILFCKQDGKEEITASSITSLPVSKYGMIDREDEHKVFKTCDYWDSMPETADCKIYLTQEIKNKLGYKVHIFTWRDWDVCYNINGDKIKKYSIKKHTKKWLKDKGILFDKLFFEKGNIDKPITLFGAKYKTRFYYSAKHNIKYFVEDNIYNAEKLSHICKYVFLVNHEYNKNESIELPFNVIRVSSWNEILDRVKELD